MLKKKPSTSSIIVTQANQLVEARYHLSLGEQRLILAMIAKIQPEDEDFKPYLIGIGELAEFMGVSKTSMYQECQKITKRLLERAIEINEASGLLQIGWVSSAKYLNGKGMVRLSFDPLLKPYLLQLKGNFTSCKLKMLLSFKSQYTMRIYNLLKQYEKLKVREIELEQLRQILGVEHSQYTLYSNFKKDIIETTRKELYGKDDIFFDYDEIKYGRRVGLLRFHIKAKEKRMNQDLAEKLGLPCPVKLMLANNGALLPSDLMKLIPEQHRHKKSVIFALTAYEKTSGYEYVKRNILYSNHKADKSYPGFLNSALKADWGHDWEIDQKELTRKIPIEIWQRSGFPTQQDYDDFMFRKQMESYGQKFS